MDRSDQIYPKDTTTAHSMSGSEELGENSVQEFNLARSSNELLIYHATRTDVVLDTFEQERVLANLPKLHKFITEALDATRFSANSINSYHGILSCSDSPVLVLPVSDHLVLLHLLVQLALQSAHPDLDDFFYLVWQFTLHVLLQSPQ